VKNGGGCGRAVEVAEYPGLVLINDGKNEERMGVTRCSFIIPLAVKNGGGCGRAVEVEEYPGLVIV